MTKAMQKVLQRVPLQIPVHWRHLHQDGRNTWFESSKMESYEKYSKATLCRNVVKNIGDQVPHKRKQSQQGPARLYYRQKRNILRQAKLHQEEVENFSVKKSNGKGWCSTIN